MTQPNRLLEGGLVDRGAEIGFTFDGMRLRGYSGDTLASALLANGIRLVGRSFKYHRPRGIFSAGPEEPNALVELGKGAHRDPNTRATVAELFDGLHATSQNRFPSLQFDFLAVNDLLSPFLAAGFYYKTFMWPAAFWEKLYEPMIRRAGRPCRRGFRAGRASQCRNRRDCPQQRPRLGRSDGGRAGIPPECSPAFPDNRFCEL
jgi:sarcosine oxidase subunit alpha